MITPLFAALQLAPILACLSAHALGTQPAPIFEPAKDQKIIVASASEATKPATPANLIPGRGIVVKVDRVNALVRINHDPISALEWPRMTMSFRLRESALAEQVKEGDVVEFFLEKSGSDYIIVKWRKQAPAEPVNLR
jgi:Cu/Ag efflux protein CusF